MPRIEIDGASLYYEDTGGDGPPIVFAHGLLWSTSLYRFQIEAFRSHHRCIAFDFRGQGKSEITRDGYDMDTLARDAASLIERLVSGPVHFVGLSMGGFVGMRVAARRPELVRSLSLIETAADAEPRSSFYKYGALSVIAKTFGLAPVVNSVMKIMFARSFLEDPARASLRASMRSELLANDVAGVLRATDGVLHRAPIESELGAIRAPTVVITGEEDRAVVPDRSRRTAHKIPGSRFVTIPRAGHTSTIEEPEAINDVLRAFWDEQSSSASPPQLDDDFRAPLSGPERETQ